MTEDGPLGASLNKAPQGTHLKALRSSLRVDVSYLSPVAGAVTALPVVAVFVVGLMAGTDSGAIAMAVGANLIAIASLVGAPRLSFRIAIIDAVFLGLSVLVGTLSGSITWLHLLILVPWCFGAGMLEVFDQTSATVGSQAVIAYVVLGRIHRKFPLCGSLQSSRDAGRLSRSPGPRGAETSIESALPTNSPGHLVRGGSPTRYTKIRTVRRPMPYRR